MTSPPLSRMPHGLGLQLPILKGTTVWFGVGSHRHLPAVWHSTAWESHTTGDICVGRQDYELLNQTCSFRQDATPFLKRDTSRRCDVRIEPSDLQFQGSTNLISHQPNDLDWALCRPDRAGQGWAVTGKVSGEDTFSRARWTSSRWSQPSIATLPLRLRSF